jgi:hypothetical protein
MLDVVAAFVGRSNEPPVSPMASPSPTPKFRGLAGSFRGDPPAKSPKERAGAIVTILGAGGDAPPIPAAYRLAGVTTVVAGRELSRGDPATGRGEGGVPFGCFIGTATDWIAIPSGVENDFCIGRPNTMGGLFDDGDFGGSSAEADIFALAGICTGGGLFMMGLLAGAVGASPLVG